MDFSGHSFIAWTWRGNSSFAGYMVWCGDFQWAFPMGLSNEPFIDLAVFPNSFVSGPTGFVRYGIGKLLNAAVAG
jgi:hypothetical protein